MKAVNYKINTNFKNSADTHFYMHHTPRRDTHTHKSTDPLPHPLQWVLQELNGTVDGLLRDVRRLSVALDLQHSHLKRAKETSTGGQPGQTEWTNLHAHRLARQHSPLRRTFQRNRCRQLWWRRQPLDKDKMRGGNDYVLNRFTLSVYSISIIWYMN